jgi:hypothetical protein
VLAGWTLLDDLEATGSLSFHSTYVEQFAGAASGLPAALEPGHWALALLAAPEIRLSLEQPRDAR